MSEVMLAMPIGNEGVRDSLAAIARGNARVVAEPKIDGMRAKVRVVNGRVVSMEPRKAGVDGNLGDLRPRFPEVCRAIEAWAAAEAGAVAEACWSITLDGELGFLDTTGLKMDIAILQSRPRKDAFRIKAHAMTYPMAYVVFDVLEVNGNDVTALPFHQRRATLEGLFEREHAEPEGGRVLLNQITRVEHPGEIVDLYDRVCLAGGEGIIVKTWEHRYQAGKRSADWIKAKAPNRVDSLHVVGVLRGTGKRESTFGAFILARSDADGTLTYVCKAGSGLTDEDLARITRIIPLLSIESCPLAKVPALDKPLLAWLGPGMTADIRYDKATGVSPRFPRVVSVSLPEPAEVP